MYLSDNQQRQSELGAINSANLNIHQQKLLGDISNISSDLKTILEAAKSAKSSHKLPFSYELSDSVTNAKMSLAWTEKPQPDFEPVAQNSGDAEDDLKPNQYFIAPCNRRLQGQ